MANSFHMNSEQKHGLKFILETFRALLVSFGSLSAKEITRKLNEIFKCYQQLLGTTSEVPFSVAVSIVLKLHLQRIKLNPNQNCL